MYVTSQHFSVYDVTTFQCSGLNECFRKVLEYDMSTEKQQRQHAYDVKT
jgi:hypothetical protein